MPISSPEVHPCISIHRVFEELPKSHGIVTTWNFNAILSLNNSMSVAASRSPYTLLGVVDFLGDCLFRFEPNINSICKPSVSAPLPIAAKRVLQQPWPPPLLFTVLSGMADQCPLSWRFYFRVAADFVIWCFTWPWKPPWFHQDRWEFRYVVAVIKDSLEQMMAMSMRNSNMRGFRPQCITVWTEFSLSGSHWFTSKCYMKCCFSWPWKPPWLLPARHDFLSMHFDLLHSLVYIILRITLLLVSTQARAALDSQCHMCLPVDVAYELFEKLFKSHGGAVLLIQLNIVHGHDSMLFEPWYRSPYDATIGCLLKDICELLGECKLLVFMVLRELSWALYCNYRAFRFSTGVPISIPLLKYAARSWQDASLFQFYNLATTTNALMCDGGKLEVTHTLVTWLDCNQTSMPVLVLAHLEPAGGNTSLRPMPWPSFTSISGGTATWCCDIFRKPPSQPLDQEEPNQRLCDALCQIVLLQLKFVYYGKNIVYNWNALASDQLVQNSQVRGTGTRDLDSRHVMLLSGNRISIFILAKVQLMIVFKVSHCNHELHLMLTSMGITHLVGCDQYLTWTIGLLTPWDPGRVTLDLKMLHAWC
ncbi:hypothetical protein BS78_05G042600 [Paspalum vaginatum]|nr:hypothetical protein BS78_05G042600 [Paspalum vaginatum]